MNEFQIQVNQSLVDNTLNQFDYNPLTVIKYPSTQFSTFELDVFQSDELSKEIEDDFDKYSKEALELVEDQYFLSEPEINQTTPSFLTSSIDEVRKSGKYKGLIDEDRDLIIVQEQVEDAISYATDISAQYVMQLPNVFGPDLVEEAEEILKRGDQYILNSTPLGFGGFLKKVWGKIKNAASKIWRWIKRQIKRVVGFGKPELKELVVNQYGRPDIRLSNPLVINGINVAVTRLRVDIPYYIKFPWDPIRWRKIRITLNNKLGAKADGVYQLKPKGLKITVKPRFTELKIRVTIIGINFWIGLTGVANKILENKEFEIYDVSNLAKPMEVKGLEYSVSSLGPVGLENGLRLDIGIEVKKKGE